MKEGFEQLPKRPIVPELFTLVDSGASSETLVQKLYEEFHSPNYSPEKLYIGFQGLLDKGHEGIAALSFIGQGNDELGELARVVTKQPNISSRKLEELLGIRRWGRVIDMDATSSNDAFTEIYKYAVAKGYTHKSLIECVRDYASEGVDHNIPQLTGDIEKHLISKSAIFGDSEPTYFELLGPMEILRLRAMRDPKFLLLGSLGAYSQRDFGNYARKINPAADSHVIDKSQISIKVMRERNPDETLLVQGDARSMPYQKDSFDQVCTNYLFHSLRTSSNVEGFKDDIERLMQETFRVLKPGGNFIILEMPYGRFKSLSDDLEEEKALVESMKIEVMSIARRSGFRLRNELVNSLSFAVTPEYSSARVDSNGFPHYEDSLIISRTPLQISLCLTKPLDI